MDTKLEGCAAAAGMMPFERVTLLFCLSKDPEITVQSAAVIQLELLPEDVTDAYAASDGAHPAVLNMLSRIAKTRSVKPAQLTESVQLTEPARLDESVKLDESSGEDEAAEEEPASVEDEEYLSKYKLTQLMGIGEKIKMALTGDKEWRSILVKDANKLVSGGVIKNPRITEAEVLALAKSGIQNDEIIRLICANREWIKNYNIRKALITNARTPVQSAMRYLDTMGERDLATFAKSKNISSVISTMAKRILLNKKK
ncbi:MAG: hypothetical protein HY888_13090 [Deltaproteobacteria bacterium]|nr:hypothetical protein [Deltaproteobacteria bacterium]